MERKHSNWCCPVCRYRKVVVVINPPEDEIVHEIKNDCGDRIAYVCARCSVIPKSQWFGIERSFWIKVKAHNYGVMKKPEQLLKPEFSGLRCLVESGLPCALTTGSFVDTYIEKDHSTCIMVKTKKNKPRRSTIAFKKIYDHYFGFCESCKLCTGEIEFSYNIDKLLKEYACSEGKALEEIVLD